MIGQRRLIFLLVALLSLGAVVAGEPKDYAYTFLQGKLTDAESGRPLVRTSVRLITTGAAFEAISDGRGVFTFEKLPFAKFELRITTPDGRVIRGVQRNDPDDPEAMRFAIKMGKGYGTGIRLAASRERLSVDVPEPKTKWARLWSQFAIYAGVAAGLVAL